MIKYEYQDDGDGGKIACVCCDYPAPLAEFEKGPGKKVVWLCQVCATTHLSKAIFHPHQVADPDLNQSIGWIANRLLDAIRET